MITNNDKKPAATTSGSGGQNPLFKGNGFEDTLHIAALTAAQLSSEQTVNKQPDKSVFGVTSESE